MNENTPPPDPQRVAVLDDTGLVVNVVLVDPDSDWDPGDGLTTVPLGDGDPVGPGHHLDPDGAWHPPTPDPASDPDAPPPPGTLADLQEQVDRLTDLVLGAR